MAATNNDLTAKQLDIRDYYVLYQAREGMPPSISEVMEHFGFASNNSVMCHIRALLAKGAMYKKITPGKKTVSRCYYVPEPPRLCPHCGGKI